MVNSENIILIPARMDAIRLPNKPLADIAGKPMIVHVAERAMKSSVGEVYVAAAEQEIIDVLKEYKIKSVLTDPSLPSGTDRVFAALEIIDPQHRYKNIINLQGDLPLIDPEALREVARLNNSSYDVTTIAGVIVDQSEIQNPNVVKIALSKITNEALYFSRSAIPHNANCYYHHIGVYGYKRDALSRFIKMKQTELELTERLEQLRFLENGTRILVGIVKNIPTSVDTAADLAKVLSQI